MNVFESIMTGLNEAIEYEQGKIAAGKTTLTIEPLPDISADEIKTIRITLDLHKLCLLLLLVFPRKQ